MRTNNIFFDTEFYAQDNRVELISIGLVRIDSNGHETEFYAENGEFDWDTCPDEWLRENVRPHLVGGEVTMSRTDIGAAVAEFVGPSPEFWAYCGSYDWTVLNQLFGQMVHHPHDWLFTFRDIAHLVYAYTDVVLPVQDENTKHSALEDARWCTEAYLAIRRKYLGPAPDRRDTGGTPGASAYLGRRT